VSKLWIRKNKEGRRLYGPGNKYSLELTLPSTKKVLPTSPRGRGRLLEEKEIEEKHSMTKAIK